MLNWEVIGKTPLGVIRETIDAENYSVAIEKFKKKFPSAANIVARRPGSALAMADPRLPKEPD